MSGQSEVGRIAGMKTVRTLAKWNHTPEELALIENGEVEEGWVPDRPPDEVLEQSDWTTLSGIPITDQESIDRLERQVLEDNLNG